MWFVDCYVYLCPSLVPRPSQSFLIACSMQKRSEKTLSILPCEWHQCPPGWTEEGRGPPLTSLRKNAFFVLKQEQYVFHFANVWSSSAWSRNYKIRSQARHWGTPPLPLSLGRHWCHSHDKMDQAFLLRFGILKNWTVGRPGNKATCTHVVSFKSLYIPVM